jgi:hypothetical protein
MKELDTGVTVPWGEIHSVDGRVIKVTRVGARAFPDPVLAGRFCPCSVVWARVAR